MKAVTGFGSIPYRPVLFGSLALLCLSGCATTGAAEPEKPSGAETVEMGYDAANESGLAGSVNTIRTVDASGLYFRTVEDMLRRIPGVRVIEMKEGGTTVRIRGASSFLGSEEPLFVIDGIVVPSIDGGLDGINPNSIESITVLKNADETAIYGSRGGNGVILIKTKKG